MIYFEDLPLDSEILGALKELSINYVFQSIFYPDGKTIFAREALMRPVEKTVTELIDEYYNKGKLHVLEVATLFGAVQEYQLRGYTEPFSLNSFPCEAFSSSEVKAFNDYYGDLSGVGIIEMLEYPEFSDALCKIKKKACKSQNIRIAIDDFGSGVNDINVVDKYEPDIVKIDRSLITGIDSDSTKQDNVTALIEMFHAKGIKVIVEGVETKEEFDYLVGIEADFFQGYYLHMPE